MKKFVAFLTAAIMIMSTFSSYACITASATQTYEIFSISDVFNTDAEKQSAPKIETPDKETEEKPLDETSDLNFMEDVKNFFHRIIEIIKAFIGFFRNTETPAPEKF